MDVRVPENGDWMYWIRVVPCRDLVLAALGLLLLL
jgi:hypothetical protein